MGGDATGRSLERQDFSVESFGNLDIDRYNFTPSGDNEPNGTPGRQNRRTSRPPRSPSATPSRATFSPLLIHAEVTGATKVDSTFANRKRDLPDARMILVRGITSTAP
jgi:hypothetical protein